MKITTNFPVKSMSGKADKDDVLVFSTRYGATYAWEMEVKKQEFSDAQKAVHEKFKNVTAMMQEELSDPAKKKEWEEKARQSGGKYKTAHRHQRIRLFFPARPFHIHILHPTPSILTKHLNPSARNSSPLPSPPTHQHNQHNKPRCSQNHSKAPSSPHSNRLSLPSECLSAFLITRSRLAFA